MADDPKLRKELEYESEGLWKHNSLIEDLMDPDYGLLDQLLVMGALSRRETHDVKSESTFEKRNTKVVECIAEHGRFWELILALRNTNQKHLANYLIADGVYQSTFYDEWPLTKEQTANLNKKQMTLIDSLVNIDDLSLAMYSANIINNRHRDTIHAQPTNHEKSEFLLDILVRRSRADYLKTIDCLEQSNNHHVVEILKSRGVVVQVIANVETSTDEKEELEKEISAKTNSLLRRPNQSSPECVEAISEIKSEKLVGTKFGHSVALYFNCESLNELNRLWKLMESGQLEDLVEKYFNRLVPREHQYKVRLKWSSDDYAVKQSIFDEVRPESVIVSHDSEQSGHVKVHPEDQSTQTEEVTSTTCAGRLQVPTRSYGVTKLNHLIYVLCRSPNTIYIFSDEHPFKQMPEIKITEVRFEGCDIGACSLSSCLYVTDTCSNSIFKIPVKHPSQMTTWLKEKLSSPWTLSICRITGDLLILRNKEPIGLELYNSKAEKIYSMQLPADMITLKHAVSISVESFIIIHKWKETGTWGISEVNKDGDIVCRFKQKSKKLYNPCHLTLDHNNQVIVTDLMTSRVVRFNRHLDWQDIILTKDKNDLQEPLRLFYDLEKRQLIVGQENGTVGIYSI